MAASKTPSMPSAKQVSSAVSAVSSATKTAETASAKVATIQAKIESAPPKQVAALEKQLASAQKSADAATAKVTAAETKLTTIVKTAQTVAATVTANASKVASGELTGKAANTAVSQAKTATTNLTAINNTLSTIKVSSAVASKVQEIKTTITPLVADTRSTYFDAAISTATNRETVQKLVVQETKLNTTDKLKAENPTITSKALTAAVNTEIKNVKTTLSQEAILENQQINALKSSGASKDEINNFQLQAIRGAGTVQTIDKTTNQVTTIDKPISEIKGTDVGGKVAIAGAGEKTFANVDPATGLPILNQAGLDKVLSKQGDNTLNSSQFRENYNQFGWDVKSDASSVTKGAAIYGIDIGKISTGVGQTKNGIVKSGTNTEATNTDLLNAGKAVFGNNFDSSKYQKTVTVPATTYGGKATTKTVLDRDALFSDINNASKDLYLVSNALNREGVYSGANKESPHASILFKADGQGNLKPVTDEKGNVAMQTYSATGAIHTGAAGTLAELAPVIQIGAMVFGGPLGGQLGAQIASTAVGQVIGTAASNVLGNMIVQGTFNGALTEAKGGSFGNGFLTAAASQALGPISNAAADGILKVIGVGPDQISSITKSINDVTGQNYSISQVGNALTRATATVLTSAAFDKNNLITNVTANLVGSAANATVTNAVESKLNDLVSNGTINIDKPTVAAITNLSGNASGLIGTALVSTGGDFEKTGAILQNSAGALVGSAISAYGNADKELRSQTPIEDRSIASDSKVIANLFGTTEGQLGPLLAAGEGYQPSVSDDAKDVGASLPAVVVEAKTPSTLDDLISYVKDSFNEYVANPASDWLLNHKQIAEWAIDNAKKTGNSTVINGTANFVKAMGGILDSYNGVVSIFGKDPDSTAAGKLAKSLQDLGSNSNTQEYKTAVADINKMLGDAKGVSGVANALYGAITKHPTTFLAETIGVEGMQEVAPLVVGGTAKLGAEAVAGIFKLANAAKFSAIAGVSAATASDILESAGGEAAGAYREAYDLAIKKGFKPEEAQNYAAGIAQKTGLFAGAVTAATMGIGGNEVAKQILGYKGTGEQLSKIGSTIDELGRRGKDVLKVTGKEAGTEALEESSVQAFNELQFYKLDPTRDVGKNIALAGAIGAISGGGVAGGVSSIDAASSIIATAQANNPEVQKILIASNGDPKVAQAELSKIGIDNKNVQINLINTVNNKAVITPSEANSIFESIPGFKYTQDDINNVVGDVTGSSERDSIINYIKQSSGIDTSKLGENSGIVLSKNDQTGSSYVLDGNNNIIEVKSSPDAGVGSVLSIPKSEVKIDQNLATVVAIDPSSNSAIVVDNKGTYSVISTNGNVNIGTKVNINTATNNVSNAGTNQNIGSSTNASTNAATDASINAALNTDVNTATATVISVNPNTNTATVIDNNGNVSTVSNATNAIVGTNVNINTNTNNIIDTKTSVETGDLGKTTSTTPTTSTTSTTPTTETQTETGSQTFPLTSTTPTTSTTTKPATTTAKTTTPTSTPAAEIIQGPPTMAQASPSPAFYYGKEFGSPTQQISETGELLQDLYQPLSVTQPGAELAAKGETGENDITALLQSLLGEKGDINDLFAILKG